MKTKTKGLLLGLFLTMAVTNAANKVDNGFYEYSIVINEYGEDTCYARFCWNIGETSRQCTDWVEVPCDTTIEVEQNIE